MATAYNIDFQLGAKLTAEFRQAFGQANKEMASLLKASQKMTSMGKNLTVGVTAPIAGMGAMAVKTFASFDDSMRNVQAVSGATGAEFEQLTQLAKDLGAETAWSASQSADAMGYLALAGWDTNQIMSATPGLLDLASAASMDLAGAADIVSDVMSAFGMSAEEAGNAADIFAQTSRKSNTDVNQLGEALKYAGSASSAAGMDLAQTNAVLGVLADSGVKGSMAGTTVVSMLRDLKKNSEDGAIAVGETSIALYDQAGNMRDLGTVMGDVEKATKGMNTQQKDAALGAVFGTEAMKGANIMLAAGSERYQELEGAIRDSNGVAKEMADNLEGGIGGAFRSMMSAVESLAISFGETLAPYAIVAAESLGNFARMISSMSNEVRLVIVVFASLLAAIGPVLLITGLLIEKVISSVAAYKAARAAISSLNIMTRIYNATQAVTTFLMNAQRAAMYGYMFAGGGVRGVIIGISSALRAMNLAFLANPFVIVAAGLALVALAFYKAWNSSETFRAVVITSLSRAEHAVLSFVEFVKTLGANIWSGITDGVVGLGSALGSVLQSEFAKSALMAIDGFVESVKVGLSSLPGIISMVTPTIATLGLSFLGVGGPIGLIIGGVLSLIGFIYRLSQTNEDVANTISSAWNAVSGAFAPIIEVFADAAERLSAELGPEIEKTMEVVAESIMELGPSFAELGGVIVELASLLAETMTENFMEFSSELLGLATTIIPIVIAVLQVLLEVFSVVLTTVLEVVMAVLPIVVQLIAAIIPIVLKIVEIVLPLLLEIIMMVFPIILEIIQAVLPIFISLLTLVVEIIMVLVEVALPLILTVVEMVLPLVLGIIEAIIPAIAMILQVLVSIIIGVVVPAINLILSVVEVVFPFIQMIIETALAIITGILTTAMALIQGDWEGAWNAIKATAETIMNNIVSFFSGIDLFSVGKAIIDGLINGIKSMASAVGGAIASLVPAPLRGAVSKVVGAIPGFAKGGVVSAPLLAWVGEGGDTESIIPWNNSQRSKDLWVQTGQAIGMLDNGVQGESASDVMVAQATPSSVDSYGVGAGGTTTNNNQDVIIKVEHKGNVIHVQGGDPQEVVKQVEESDAQLYERIMRIIEDLKRKDL